MKRARRAVKVQVQQWALVLFDVDGNTAKVKSSRLTQPVKAARTQLFCGRQRFEVEVLELSDCGEELNSFEDQWVNTQRALAIDKEIEKRQNSDQQENGFLDIWPTDEHSDHEPEQKSDDDDHSIHEAEPNQEQPHIIEQLPETPVIGERPTEFKGNNNRLVKVLFQGGGDYTGRRAEPERSPLYTQDLTPDQVDMVNNQINNVNRGVTDRGMQTEKVIVIDTSTNLRELVSKPRDTKTVFTQTEGIQWNPAPLLEMPNQLTEVLRLLQELKAKQTNFPTTDLSSIALPDIDFLDYATPNMTNNQAPSLGSFLSTLTTPSFSTPTTVRKSSASKPAALSTPTISTASSAPSISASSATSSATSSMYTISFPLLSPEAPTISTESTPTMSAESTPTKSSESTPTISASTSTSSATSSKYTISFPLPSPEAPTTSASSSTYTISFPQQSPEAPNTSVESTPTVMSTLPIPTESTTSTVVFSTTTTSALSSIPSATTSSTYTISFPPSSPETPPKDNEPASTPSNTTSTPTDSNTPPLELPTATPAIQHSFSLSGSSRRPDPVCFPGPIQEVRNGSNINPNIKELRIHQETIANIKAVSQTDNQFIWNLTKALFSIDELRNTNFTGQKGKKGLSPRRKHAIQHCVIDNMGPEKVTKIGQAINNGIRNAFRFK